MSSSHLEHIIEEKARVIQGGMGTAVSDWNLGGTVSSQGSLGVVSGTGIDSVFARRLQMGDKGGHMKRALEHFPFPQIAEEVYDKYFIQGGKFPHIPFKNQGMFSMRTPKKLLQLNTLANFVEVFLAKEGHDNPVGINYLEKLQFPHLSALYGAMLAEVDGVLMGAGMPFQIPGVLDTFSNHNKAEYRVSVTGATRETNTTVEFDPKTIFGELAGELKRPDFLAIVSSTILAKKFAANKGGKVNGLIVEEPVAGGHNAPPRVKNVFNENNEPLYGVKDEVNYEAVHELGLPWWSAGGYGSPEQLRKVNSLGGVGIQVGSLFSLTNESGYSPKLKKEIIESILKNNLKVFTDPKASPTGFPFKVLQMKNTLSEKNIYEDRKRICDIGYLRENYLKENGSVGYRCSAEVVKDYVRKGGTLEETQERKCLCNGLMANIGLGQLKKNGLTEMPLLTAGDEINTIKKILNGRKSYSAKDVLDYLLER